MCSQPTKEGHDMKYEIITDKEDLLVLVVNNRVIAVSSDMPTVIEIMHKNYEDTVNKTQRVYLPALIHPELDDDMYKEDKLVAKGERLAITPSQRNEILHTKEGLDTTLGKLFNI